MFLDASYTVERPENPGDFFQEALLALGPQESLNALVLSLANRYQFAQGDFPYVGLCRDRDQITLCLLSKHNTKLRFICSPTQNFDMLQSLVQECLGEGHLPDSAVVEAETAKLLKTCFSEAGYTCETHFHQGVYRCKTPTAPSGLDRFEMILANEDHLDVLGHWVNEFVREAMAGGEPVDGFQMARERIEKDSLFLLAQDGLYVGMASWSRPLTSSVSVNLVYTPPEQRGKGYAKAITYLLTKKLIEEDGFKETNLYTDMENDAANTLYVSIGYELIGRSEMFGIGKA